MLAIDCNQLYLNNNSFHFLSPEWVTQAYSDQANSKLPDRSFSENTCSSREEMTADGRKYWGVCIKIKINIDKQSSRLILGYINAYILEYAKIN